MHVYPTKSSRIESTVFASVMIDDVGCSRCHHCPRCDKQIVPGIHRRERQQIVIFCKIKRVGLLKWKCCHSDEIFITGCTRGYHFYNCCCSQWLKFCQNDIFVLMSVHYRHNSSTKVLNQVISLLCSHIDIVISFPAWFDDIISMA